MNALPDLLPTGHPPTVNDPLDVEKLALVGTMRLAGRWHATRELLPLYTRR